MKNQIKTTKAAGGKPDVDILRNAMLFSLSTHRWGNRVSVRQKEKNEKVTVKADKKELNITKRLMISRELKAINDKLNEAYAWCTSRSMQSTVRKGVFFVKRDMIEPFEDYLAGTNKEIENVLVPAFIKTYIEAKEKAKGLLEELYHDEDYPAPETMKSLFGFSWSWLSFSVPDELPEEVGKRECAKLQKAFEEAQVEVRYILREGLKELVAHAVERLQVKPGEKAKVLRDKSLVSNFQEFFDTFNARNLTDDTELTRTMEQARKLIEQFDPDGVRKSVDVRNDVASKFKDVEKALDKMLVDRPKRRFAFDEE